MKLKVIGSGNISSKYNSASYLIDDKILIDVPNGTCKILKNMGINPSKIKDILITHFHGDHFLDIPFILINKIIDDSESSNIYCDNTGESKIYNVVKISFQNIENEIDKYFKYNYNDKFNINNYEIEKIKLKHEDIIEHGYIFNQNGKYIGFTGDTELCENVEIMASKCSNLICECTLQVGGKGHIGIDNIKYLANKYPNCTFYTTHMNDTTREKLKELDIKNVIILYDNDEIIF